MGKNSYKLQTESSFYYLSFVLYMKSWSLRGLRLKRLIEIGKVAKAVW